jgi:hypothetical protein
MNMHTGLYALTGINLVVLGLGVVSQLRPAQAQGEAEVLRGRGLEIVDSHGRIRASITVLPAGRSSSGDAQSETVLFRLITERGRPTVKIAASEPLSGLSVAGPTGTKDAYLILQTKGNKSSLRLRNEDGQEQLLGP